MFNWKTMVAVVVLAPFVALLGGMGVLFYQIGQHWDARSTDSLIAGLVATCGGGAVVIGVLLAIIIGVPFAIRMLREAGQADQMWHSRSPYPPLPPAGSRPPAWLEQPPRLFDKPQGSWRTLGQHYDIWDEERPTPGEIFEPE